MLQFYFDEDAMRQATVNALRARGIDVRTALEEAMLNRHDTEHLEYATSLGRVLYSYNMKDYQRIP